jgi:5,10-methylenetetrahydrofolate reductase
MRDERRVLSGRPLSHPPELFIGAAENPFAPPHDFRPLRLAKKIAAGAQFIQTQYCYDLPVLERFMTRVRDLGLHEKCFILVGVGPLASARAARWIREHVPGVHIPDPVIARLEGAAKQREEGKRICIELIEQIRELEGVSGIHLMAYRQEEAVAEIIERSGALRGRRPHNVIARWAAFQQRRALALAPA